jgi:hypothetical protein
VLYVSAAGFTPGFGRKVEEEGDGRRVIAWTLDDVYAAPGAPP